MKLNVLLARTDNLASNFKAMIKNYSKFFVSSQGAFKGNKSTYEAKEGFLDEPTKRGNTLVQTTVNEKLQWFKENSKDYIDSLFSQEKTNASGQANAELVVEGESWGTFTSLELLRLKSLLETSDISQVLSNIPVRSDAQIWNKSENPMYEGRDIYETELNRTSVKTTIKEEYILPDPNLKEGSNYNPQVSVKTSVVEMGDSTRQDFSGEWTQRQKADALRRRTILLTAVIEALKVCNETESLESQMKSDKIFGYIFGI